ncbi:MAG: type II toxin-antitoxin system HicA family toxin [Schwartzia sp.]|nr:type II toxin-antitoxin system HicA family toxin [Schwartzia sp. (in: firmicutes)]
MPRIGEFKRELQKAGCYLTGHGGRHDDWYSPITGQSFQIPRHDGEELPKWLETRLRKIAGVPKKR